MITRKPSTIYTEMEMAEIDMLIEKRGKLCLLDKPLYKHDDATHEKVELEAGSPVYIVQTSREPGCVAITVEDATGERWIQYMSDLGDFYSVFNTLDESNHLRYIPEHNPKAYRSRKRFCKLANALDAAFPSLLLGPALIMLAILLYVVAGSATMQNMISWIPGTIIAMATISLIYGAIQSIVGYAAFFMFYDSDYAWYNNDKVFINELRTLVLRHNISWTPNNEN